mmetsp:Transcript_21686/g.56611  ORF Transcript_21686/g.56611 Transcript_21686/m.56611 type:complete len:135 (-) Transcript_21686:59-463(-)
MLACHRLQSGLGLSAAVAAATTTGAVDAAADDGDPAMWSVPAVARHLDESEVPDAAKLCVAHDVTGDVLLSMTIGDVLDQLQLPGGVPAARAFIAVVDKLRAQRRCTSLSVKKLAPMPSAPPLPLPPPPYSDPA